jgi:molybdopterin synthase catalytic subunit
MALEIQEKGCYVALTHDSLDVKAVVDRVRDPKAGAIVLFAGECGGYKLSGLMLTYSGTTRDNFEGKAVKELQYTSYQPRALQSMLKICQIIHEKHSLSTIAMIHRLGTVPTGEESILIAVSSPHRQAAWRAGEEALEECKAKVEIWKKEEFGGEEGGLWRANRDGAAGVKIGEGPAQGPHGPIIRPRRPGEHGHGAVAHPR